MIAVIVESTLDEAHAAELWGGVSGWCFTARAVAQADQSKLKSAEKRPDPRTFKKSKVRATKRTL